MGDFPLMEVSDNMLDQLEALEQAIMADNAKLGALGATVDNNISLGFTQTGTNPDGNAFTATTEFAFRVTIAQGAAPPPPPPPEPEPGSPVNPNFQ